MFKFTVPSPQLRPARHALGMLAFALCAWSGWAQAGEAGKIVLVHGAAKAAERALAVGDAVAEGEELSTGADGYIYLRTIDKGLLILRPSSRARIVTYHVDRANPANTRIKFELLSGVARSVSGEAVKLARQNFRFNTPVAAIGVRGTDFTVYTDHETSRVTVISGGIVVSGFGGNCSPDGAGPCEHGTSRELSAAQVGQMLQVARGSAVPQLLSATGGAPSPDTIAPARNDEPLAKSTSAAPADVSLDPKKSDGLLTGGGAAVAKPPVAVVVTPPVVAAPESDMKLAWGRWAVLAGAAPTIDMAQQAAAKAERVAFDSYYAIYRSSTTGWTPPQQGSMGFALAQSEAFVRNEDGSAISAARLENGQMSVNFGKATFATSFDLLSGAERFKLQAQGIMTADGLLQGDNQFAAPTNMNVSGALGPENGTSAAYIFSSRLDANRIANGVTFWNKR